MSSQSNSSSSTSSSSSSGSSTITVRNANRSRTTPIQSNANVPSSNAPPQPTANQANQTPATQAPPLAAASTSNRPVPPPFNPRTFNRKNYSPNTLAAWERSPSLVLDESVPPSPSSATSPRTYVRRQKQDYGSPEVVALGKNPFPGLRQTRQIPELNKSTPAYEHEFPWVGSSLTLRYVTPQRLLELGCINGPDNTSRRFMVNQQAVNRASKQRGHIRPFFGNAVGIHPVFRRKNWLNMSDFEYEHVKPALRVASRFMHMESALDLWTALGKPWAKTPGTRLAESKGGFYQYFTGRSTVQERLHTAGEWVDMQNFVTFDWGDVGSDFGEANPVLPRKPGLRPTGESRASKITLNEDYLYILTGGTALNASHYFPAADNHSALLRVQFSLAMTLVHELTHVWNYNTTSVPRHKRHDVQPYCNDQRIAEEGMALEACIIKDALVMSINANPSILSTPFGMRTHAWPGCFEFESYNTKASAAKHGVTHETEYAVPMDFIAQFFTDEFWDKRVERFGSGALTVSKAVGVRKRINHSLQDFDPLESPRVKRRFSPTSKKMVDDPEDFEPDAWYPKIDEGILYRNKVTSVMGQELNPNTGTPKLNPSGGLSVRPGAAAPNRAGNQGPNVQGASVQGPGNVPRVRSVREEQEHRFCGCPVS